MIIIIMIFAIIMLMIILLGMFPYILTVLNGDNHSGCYNPH